MICFVKTSRNPPCIGRSYAKYRKRHGCLTLGSTQLSTWFTTHWQKSGYCYNTEKATCRLVMLPFFGDFGEVVDLLLVVLVTHQLRELVVQLGQLRFGSLVSLCQVAPLNVIKLQLQLEKTKCHRTSSLFGERKWENCTHQNFGVLRAKPTKGIWHTPAEGTGLIPTPQGSWCATEISITGAFSANEPSSNCKHLGQDLNSPPGDS